MKKLFLMMCAASFMTAALVGCGGANSGDPKSVAMAFIDKIKVQDFDGAAKYATKDSKSALDMMKSAMSMAKMFDKDGKSGDMDFDKEWKGKKVEYTEPKIDGDNATVSLMADGKEQMPISLKKEDVEWKVAFDKNTLMKTGTDKMNESNEEMPNMNDMTDSLKQIMKDAGNTMDSVNKVLEKQ